MGAISCRFFILMHLEMDATVKPWRVAKGQASKMEPTPF